MARVCLCFFFGVVGAAACELFEEVAVMSTSLLLAA